MFQLIIYTYSGHVQRKKCVFCTYTSEVDKNPIATEMKKKKRLESIDKKKQNKRFI